MSNIGKKPIIMPSGVSVDIIGDVVRAQGPKGTLDTIVPKGIKVTIADGKIVIVKETEDPNIEKFFGLTRTLIANIVRGVMDGFEKKLELVGVGYRARVEGRDLVLTVGFAIPVRLSPPEGVTVAVEENIITVAGSHKQMIGDFSAKVREVRPPDPYKGKGIRYVGEHVRKKAGKTGKTATAS